MLIVAGFVRIDIAKVDGAIEAARSMMAATRMEPGCISYTFATDLEDESVIRIFEEWESAAALQAHFKTPHMADFQKTLSELGPTELKVQRYDVARVAGLSD
jgi:quinol monooxygenase YgiN